MKKILLSMMALFTVILLVACVNIPKYSIDDIENAIEITYAVGDDQDHVTEDIILPRTHISYAEAFITWQSNNIDVITNSGAVTRTSVDVEVTLIYSISYNGQARVGSFTVTVLSEKPTLEEIAAAIEIGFSDGDDADHVTQDIILPEVSVLDENAIITWSSSNRDIISGNGVVHRDENTHLIILNFIIIYDNNLASGSFGLTVYPEDVYYSVVFDTNGGSYIEDISQLEGTAVSEPTQPTREDYTFVAWYIDEALTIPYDFTEVVWSDITLYAKWDTNLTYHTITFETNGGIDIPPLLALDNTTISRPTPVREGFIFKGWYANDSLTIPYNFYAPITSNITIYAMWTVSYTVTFNTVGGSYVSPIEVQENESITQPSDPTRSGFVFVGWFTDQAYTTEFNFYSSITEDKILYAKWESTAVYFTVSFDTNGGTNIPSNEVAVGTTLTRPNDPSKNGYVFLDWYTDVSLTTVYSFSNIVTQDIILYAKWIEPSSTDYTGIYDGAEGLYGSMLIDFLYDVVVENISGKEQDYGDARYTLDEADRDPNNPSNVILVYLGTSVSGVWDGGATWNREHVWPQSLLGVSADNSTVNMASDLHNLKPANPSENSSRSNKWFGDTTTAYSYAPRTDVRGDIARILFYMAIRYNDTLTLINITSGDPSVHQMGDLATLLRWNLEDPVDTFEMNRNDVIESYQGNRNPFIDYPDFAYLIWS